MRAFFLLVLLICILAYVRAQQPATWNSWMVAIGANSLVTPVAAADNADAPGGPAPPDVPLPAPPPRVVPVGGMIQNGNFVASAGLWQGDGQPDPSGKGLVVRLSPSAWTRVYQAFPSGAGTLYSIEVTYKLSPGCTLSQDPNDYTDISKRLQIDGFERFSSEPIPPGNFFGTIGDPTSTSTCCEYYAPQIGSTAVQDYQHNYPAIPPNGTKTFALAFPPGTGTVTLVTAYVTCH